MNEKKFEQGHTGNLRRVLEDCIKIKAILKECLQEKEKEAGEVQSKKEVIISVLISVFHLPDVKKSYQIYLGQPC